MRETQGEKVSATEMFDKLFTCLQVTNAQQLKAAEGKWFVGSIMNHHGIKQGGLEQLAQPLKQVQVDDQSTHPSIHQSFVASGRCIEPDAPALETWKRWNPWRQGLTQTRCRLAALAWKA